MAEYVKARDLRPGDVSHWGNMLCEVVEVRTTTTKGEITQVVVVVNYGGTLLNQHLQPDSTHHVTKRGPAMDNGVPNLDRILELSTEVEHYRDRALAAEDLVEQLQASAVPTFKAATTHAMCNVPFKCGEVTLDRVRCILPNGHRGWHQHADSAGGVRWQHR